VRVINFLIMQLIRVWFLPQQKPKSIFAGTVEKTGKNCGNNRQKLAKTLVHEIAEILWPNYNAPLILGAS